MEPPDSERQPGRVTLEDIAASLHLGRSTVGRALQGHPHVSPKTRKRVEAAASAMGYRPDPAVAALARRRWPSGAHSGSVTLGFISWVKNAPSSSRTLEWFERILRGASSRASSLGYHLDRFQASSYPDWHRLCEVLESRGIRGIVIQAFPEDTIFEFDWDRFACVFLGPENDQQHLHSVQCDFSAALHLALRKCREAGCRRPGIALFDHKAWGTDRPFNAQALLEGKLDSGLAEIFRYGKAADCVTFNRWVRREMPDAIVATNPWPYHWLRKIQSSRRVPRSIRDCQLVLVRRPEPGIETAHVDLCEDQQASHAIDLVHQMLQYGRIGLPKLPLRILIPPSFVPGPTLCGAG